MSDEEFGPVQRGGAGMPDPSRARPVPPGPGDEDFGPVRRGRAGRPWPRRLAVGLLSATAVLTVAIAGTVTALLMVTSADIERSPVDGLSAVAGRMNVLLVGSDSRTGLTAEELQRLGTHEVDGQRADTILLLSISGGRAAMLSFPRDLLVTRCDQTRGRINAAYGIGGPGCLVKTITASTGIPVSHYLEVNFVGFMRMVDAVGGVPIWLDEPLRDVHAGIDLAAGCVQLDGAAALGFVRARRVDSDLGRIQRQQRFLSELAEQVTKPVNLVNVPRLFSVARAGASALSADEGLSALDLARLARGGRGLAGGGLASYTIPTRPDRVGGAAVLVPTDEAARILARFRDGSVLDGESPDQPGPQPESPPGDAPGAPDSGAPDSGGDAGPPEPTPEQRC